MFSEQEKLFMKFEAYFNNKIVVGFFNWKYHELNWQTELKWIKIQSIF